MAATLKVTHTAIGAEVRRGPYDVVVDGERVGSVDMNGTIEIPVEPGRHGLTGAQRPKVERHGDVRRRRRRDRRLPMHRKAVLAALSGLLHRSQAGAETCSRVSPVVTLRPSPSPARARTRIDSCPLRFGHGIAV